MFTKKLNYKKLIFTTHASSVGHFKKLFLFTSCFLSVNATAGNMGRPVVENHLWSITAGMGYSNIQSMYQSDGQTVLGRLAFGRHLFGKYKIAVGSEVGVQNGNGMRLNATEETLNALGGLPIQTTIKPSVDLLATFKTKLFHTNRAFNVLKGGIIYRQWQFDERSSINTLTNISGEVQAGFGYALNHMTGLSVVYQGIFGGIPNITVDKNNAIAVLSTLPIQQGGLLTLTVSI